MSGDRLEQLIENLRESFNGKPWYGKSVWEKLAEIPWQIVNERTYGTKSIAVLVRHIINWRLFVIRKLEGDLDFNIIIDGENDWDDIVIPDQEAWQSLLRELEKTQSALLHGLSGKTDGLLAQKVPGKDYSFGPILISIAQHDIYHLGQIAMLNAMHEGKGK